MITDTAVIRWISIESGESAQRESRLADELCKVISKAQLLYIK